MTIITKFPRTQTKLWTLFLHVIVFSARVTCFQLSMASTRPVFRETRVFTELKTIGTPNKLDDTTLLGGQTVSCLGVGAWAWGDKLFWGYDDSMNQELEEVSLKIREFLFVLELQTNSCYISLALTLVFKEHWYKGKKKASVSVVGSSSTILGESSDSDISKGASRRCLLALKMNLKIK